MKYLSTIIAWFSPLMRDTLELEKLNTIWERFNADKNRDVALDAILSHKWKYHKDKVVLLLQFIHLCD